METTFCNTETTATSPQAVIILVVVGHHRTLPMQSRMKWSDVMEQIENDRRSPDYTPDQTQETLATTIENCKANHDHTGRLLAERQFVDNLLTGKDMRARFYFDDMFRMIPGAVEATDWRYAPSASERVDEEREARYDEFRINIKTVDRSDLEDMLLQLMSNIHDEQIRDIYTVRDYVMNWVDHKKVTREDLECAAAARAASVAPKRRRKDALVPMCSGDKRYRCLICGVSSNRPDHIKKSCKDWENHMEHGRHGVVHTGKQYDKFSDTCANCRQVMPLCAGLDNFGCVKCQIFAQTEDELIKKCMEAKCPIHEHITCHKTCIHRYEVGDDNMCLACRPKPDESDESDEPDEDSMCITCPPAEQEQSQEVPAQIPAEQPKAAKRTRRSSLEVTIEKAITAVSNDMKEELEWGNAKDRQNMIDKYFSGEDLYTCSYLRAFSGIYDDMFGGTYSQEAYDEIEAVLTQLGWKIDISVINQGRYDEMVEIRPHPVDMMFTGVCDFKIVKNTM